jgi:uncharacterized membrane protein YkoI
VARGETEPPLKKTNRDGRVARAGVDALPLPRHEPARMKRTSPNTARHGSRVLPALAVALSFLGAPQLVPAGSVSMEQAVKMTEKQYHARVVKAETRKDDGHTVYVLRLLDDAGRVRTVRVDAATGAVL